jgi:hypothetical protein
MQFVKPAPFTEAVDKLDSKTVVGSGLNSEQWSNVPLALRERGFFSSQIESVRFLQRGRDSLADFLQGNRETLDNGQTALKTGSRADFIKQMQDFAIAEGMGPLDPADEGSIKDIRTERRLGLIFDVQTRQAQDYGYWKQGMDVDVLNAYPAQRFIRETPVKEPRDYHQLHENEVQLKTNLGFWMALNHDFKVPWGPWGWGCGHTVEDVDRAEAVRIGLLKPDQEVKPADLDFNEKLQASVQNIDPDLKAQLKEQFGDQIVITDETAHWVGNPESKPSSPAPKSEPVAPAAAPAPEVKPSKAVSAALTVTREYPQSIHSALETLDRIHDDGILPEIQINGNVPQGAEGIYAHFRDGRRPYIGIRNKPGEEFFTYHELGHFIDQHGLGKGATETGTKSMASEFAHPDLQEWGAAIDSSALVAKLKGDLPEADRYTRQHINYLLRRRELWARSYSQWLIAKILQGGHGEVDFRQRLAKRLDSAREHPYNGQWSDDDFAPISAAIDTLFKKKGWLK